MLSTFYLDVTFYILKNYLQLYVCMHVYLRGIGTCAYRYLQKPSDQIPVDLEKQVLVSYALWMLGTNLGPLEEQCISLGPRIFPFMLCLTQHDPDAFISIT